MKEILHEYGFLIIAVIVVVALILIVSVAKAKISKSANATTDSLNTMSSSAIDGAKKQVDNSILVDGN